MSAPAWVWHDVEHGGYEADLPVWRELADQADGPVLDLGAGTGRVAADLSSRGHEVVALDSDAALLDELARRARAVATVAADARSFELEREFALVLAPMQLVQIVGGREGRLALLRRVEAHLAPGGAFAAALVAAHEAVPGEDAEAPLPDMLERDGWVFSSRPLCVREHERQVVVERRRQAVSPRGELLEEHAQVVLDVVSVDELEAELRSAGLEPVERRTIPETPDHIGSTVVICRR